MRQLRIARGLTQSELGNGRFSKEYVSQIERGRVRASADALEWLAERLGVGRDFLDNGISEEEHERALAVLACAEAALGAQDAREALRRLAELSTISGWNRALELRALLAEAAARADLGEVQRALGLLEHARDLAGGPGFGDADRAAVLFELGRCRYKLSSIPTALALLTEALELLKPVGLEGDALRARIYRWRSRCYRRQRDWEAAREDVERALELGERLNDRHALAHGYFQASIIAEREGRWLKARSYAERAKSLYEEHDDRLNVGRLLNNLGGLAFLLGNPDEAVERLTDAVRVALDVGSDADAAQAVSSLAQVQLKTGEPESAERHAREALRLLDGRVDFTDEIGNAQLVLARALLEQGRLDEADESLTAAEASFERLGSASHRAAAWMARAELARRRGDPERAIDLYRLAAETLQDYRF